MLAWSNQSTCHNSPPPCVPQVYTSHRITLNLFTLFQKTADPDAVPARNRDPQAPRNRRGDIRGGCERLSGSANWRPAAQVHATAVVFHGHRSKVFTIHWISNGLWERLTVVLVYLPSSISIIIARSALHDYIILLCIYVIYIIVHIIFDNHC